MKNLISENKFTELADALAGMEHPLQVHQALLQALRSEPIDHESFKVEPATHANEWIEGIDLYRYLDKSALDPAQLEAYRNALLYLIYQVSAYVRKSSVIVTENGPQSNPAFSIHPELRPSLQDFLDLLQARDLKAAFATMAATKAQLANSMNYDLQKHEIGEDMLQFADSYVAIGQEAHATRIYQAIVADFGSESERLSSGLLPEVNHIDTRPDAERAICNKAQYALEQLTNH